VPPYRTRKAEPKDDGQHLDSSEHNGDNSKSVHFALDEASELVLTTLRVHLTRWGYALGVSAARVGWDLAVGHRPVRSTAVEILLHFIDHFLVAFIVVKHLLESSCYALIDGVFLDKDEDSKDNLDDANRREDHCIRVQHADAFPDSAAAPKEGDEEHDRPDHNQGDVDVVQSAHSHVAVHLKPLDRHHPQHQEDKAYDGAY